MSRVRLIITGDVQGVGFRAWVRRYARDTSLLTGWVKNRDDGTVEVLAEGGKKDLEEFIKQCEQGPEVAWVQGVEVTWEEATDELVGFEVVY